MNEPHRRTSIGPRRNPATEAAILAAARMILAEKGYEGFSMEEVARRAGAGKPTLYRWWPTKADLFLAVYGAEKDAVIVMQTSGSLSDDVSDYTERLFAFWRGFAGRSLKGLIAEAQGSAHAMMLLKQRILPERAEALRQRLIFSANQGVLHSGDIEPRLTLLISFFWFSLLTDQLNPEEAQMRAILSLVVPQHS